MAETIAEFVAKLGLQVDKAQEQRFNSSLSNLGKTLAWMAAGLTAAATTIQATVVAVSKSFDTLYFAAQRTNSTVAGIKALSYAFSQIGSSGNEAQTALEGLARAMRTNPGISKWLNAQGIATEGRKTEDVLGDVFEQFKKKPYFIGYQFAQLAGISEDTFNKASTQWDEVRKFVKEYEETQRKFGVDPDKAAKSSNELMTAFRGLMANLDALLTKVTTALQPQLNQMLKDISGWFEQHQEQIVRVLERILVAMGQMVEDFAALATKLGPVVDKFLQMVEALTGKDGLKVALEVLTTVTLAAFIASWMGFLAGLLKNPAFLGLLALMGIGYDMFMATPDEKIGLGGKVDNFVNGGASEPDNWWTRSQNAVRRRLGMPEVDNKGQPRGQNGASGSYGSGGASGSWSGEGVNPELTRRYDAMLAAAPEGVRSGVRVTSGFRSEERQRQLWEEALRKYGSPEEARKWVAPPGKSQHNKGEAFDLQFDTPEARAWFHEHAKEFGLTFPLPNENWHMERSEGRGQNPNWQDDATRLKDKQSELFGAPPLGASSSRTASLSNRTSITIYGSSDPAGSAANLSGAQNRVASDLIRNAQSAFV